MSVKQLVVTRLTTQLEEERVRDALRKYIHPSSYRSFVEREMLRLVNGMNGYHIITDATQTLIMISTDWNDLSQREVVRNFVEYVSNGFERK